METPSEVRKNRLANEPINRLIVSFAIPSIISTLVSALYNIVDQIFIGQGVGMLGNAATNVAFPLTTLCAAVALLIGVGTASNFNLEMGAGNRERAGKVVGTGLVLLACSGIAIGLIVITFLEPLLNLFGATENVLPYAKTYTGITSFGLPMLVFITGGSNLIRSDGSPRYAMLSMISGAILNTILDPLFIFVFDMGIAGAAWATVIGQAVSFLMVVGYFIFRYKSIKLTKELFRPKPALIKAIASLGAAACFNQVAMMFVQIVLNNTLTKHGAASIYGSDIPLAVVGVISKVNIIFMAFVLGIAHGCQPIVGFNYGARSYTRVKKTYGNAIKAALMISVVAFFCFQVFPRQIVAIFGQGSEEYFRFAERYLRIYMMGTIINGIQPVTANFFTSIGKAKKGIFVSMTRQIIFLIPLILLFSSLFGIDGVMYAGPIADAASVILAGILVTREMRIMPKDGEPAPHRVR